MKDKEKIIAQEDTLFINKIDYIQMQYISLFKVYFIKFKNSLVILKYDYKVYKIFIINYKSYYIII